jgi:hypothetical protein
MILFCIKVRIRKYVLWGGVTHTPPGPIGLMGISNIKPPRPSFVFSLAFGLATFGAIDKGRGKGI